MNSRKIKNLEREINVICSNILRNFELVKQGEILIESKCKQNKQLLELLKEL